MSKSKRQPIIKDKNKYFQKLGNRKMRNKVNQLLKKEEYDNLPEDKSELINDYDVSDYKFFIDKKDKHQYRQAINK